MYYKELGRFISNGYERKIKENLTNESSLQALNTKKEVSFQWSLMRNENDQMVIRLLGSEL